VGSKATEETPFFNVSTDPCLKNPASISNKSQWIFHKHIHNTQRERERAIRFLVSKPSGELDRGMGRIRKKKKKTERQCEKFSRIHETHTKNLREKNVSFGLRFFLFNKL
jgi:hypothetical protein